MLLLILKLNLVSIRHLSPGFLLDLNFIPNYYFKSINYVDNDTTFIIGENFLGARIMNEFHVHN
jgi:hypothetical protein